MPPMLRARGRQGNEIQLVIYPVDKLRRRVMQRLGLGNCHLLFHLDCLCCSRSMIS
jgi:hypothetical protein